MAYEWLCGDHTARFEEIYGRLGMTWNAGTERRVRQTNTESDNRTYSLNRPTAFQVDRWKERVTPDEIAAYRRFVEQPRRHLDERGVC